MYHADLTSIMVEYLELLEGTQNTYAKFARTYTSYGGNKPICHGHKPDTQGELSLLEKNKTEKERIQAGD
jgi:hypothetical protein